MTKLLQNTLAVLAAASVTGCASTGGYFVDRGRDAADNRSMRAQRQSVLLQTPVKNPLDAFRLIQDETAPVETWAEKFKAFQSTVAKQCTMEFVRVTGDADYIIRIRPRQVVPDAVELNISVNPRLASLQCPWIESPSPIIRPLQVWMTASQAIEVVCSSARLKCTFREDEVLVDLDIEDGDVNSKPTANRLHHPSISPLAKAIALRLWGKDGAQMLAQYRIAPQIGRYETVMGFRGITAASDQFATDIRVDHSTSNYWLIRSGGIGGVYQESGPFVFEGIVVDQTNHVAPTDP